MIRCRDRFRSREIDVTFPGERLEHMIELRFGFENDGLMRNTAKKNVFCCSSLFFEKIENELADSLDDGSKTRTCL